MPAFSQSGSVPLMPTPVLYFSIAARVVSASNLPNITDGIPRVEESHS